MRPAYYGAGWHPETPSRKDFTGDHEQVRPMYERIGLHRKGPQKIPARMDLRQWCSPVHFQGFYNTCQAHVVTSMLELLENRASGSTVAASRLFLYQVTRRMLQQNGDPGIYIRQMMGTLAMVGVPPEKYYPYLDVERPKDSPDPRLEQDPDAFCYAVGRNYGGLKYVRLDPSGRAPQNVLHDIRTHAAASLPCSMGFPLYEDALVQAAGSGGRIPYAEKDELVGTHAVLVVGYDDGMTIANTAEQGLETVGAFLIKNSWSDRWGEKGYGWLPYEYLLAGHARDCWIMMHPKWVETGRFDLQMNAGDSSGSPLRN